MSLKRPLSNYFLFKDDVWADVKASNPDLGVTHLMSTISAMWKDLHKKEKDAYTEKAKKLREVYE